MFFVFNKPKIYSYLIVLSTVVVLFFTATVLSEANNMETLTTSSNIGMSNNYIEKFETEKKEIAIVINCLEDDRNIEKILEKLEKNNVKANFALYGEWVKKYPELTKKIKSKGNCIINMSDDYIDMSELNYNESKKKILEGANKLNSLLNTDIKLFKCPYGKENENVLKICEEKGYKIIKGSIETLDYQGIEANVIWDNIKNQITSGDIININSNSMHILEEIELISKKLLEREYKLITLDSIKWV